MKIVNDTPAQGIDLVRTNTDVPHRETKAGERANKGSQDIVDLSTKKARFEQIKTKVKSLPPQRIDKVNQVREAIISNTYNIRGELVSKELLKEHILDLVL